MLLPPATHDFNSDSYADILWRDTSGDTTIWLIKNAGVASGVSLGNIPTVWSVVGSADFNGDGTVDILWRDTSGDVAIWLMQNAGVQTGISLGNVPTAWTVVGTGDFNGDGTADILWRDTSGDTTIWLGPFTGGHVFGGFEPGYHSDNDVTVIGTGDFER